MPLTFSWIDWIKFVFFIIMAIPAFVIKDEVINIKYTQYLILFSILWSK